jgi:propanol-preferring alcohol dehydrogenase
MASTMRAYRVVDWGRAELVEIPIPAPAEGQILVRVAGNGLCHSDFDIMRMPAEIGPLLDWKVPFTIGHESAGWVEAVGAGVTKVKPGDAVALLSPQSCGACQYCVRGHDSACPNGNAGRGYGTDGGLADYVLAGAERAVIPLGTLDPTVAGPLTDAGATAYHAVSRAKGKLVPGSTAVVIGAGGLGSFAIQFLRVMSPARVIAVDSNPARLAFARELGAHETMAGVDGETTARLLELTGGDGAHAIIDFVGIDDTIDAGLAAVRRTGAFVLVGAAGGTFRRPWYGGLPREADIIHFQGSTIAHLQEVVSLAGAGLVRSEIDRFSLDDIDAAYRALDEGRLRGRAVVIP